MFCPKCGKQVDESDVFCRSCGQTLSKEKPASAGVSPTTVGPGTAGAGNAVEPTKRSGEATASLILGLFSFTPIVGLLAVIFGHLAKASIRRSGGRLLGSGMASFGLFLGYLGLGSWVIYGLVVVTLSARRRADETSAVVLLQTINNSAMAYLMHYHGFPPSLAALGPPKTGTKQSAEAAGFIPEGEASGIWSGYRITYAGGRITEAKPGMTIAYVEEVLGPPDSKDAFPGTAGATYYYRKDGSVHFDGGKVKWLVTYTYTIHADPVIPGETGDKYFYTDHSGVIRQDPEKQADARSSPIRDQE